MRLVLAIALVAAVGCGKKKKPAPAPADAAAAKQPPSKQRTVPKLGPKSSIPHGNPPDCEPVMAGLDIAEICGEPFGLEVKAGPGAQCALVPSADAPKNHLVRISVRRTNAPRLPPQWPAAGIHTDRGKTSTARRGAYPWQITIRSRGPETALCAGDEIAALSAKVAELLPRDPEAKEAPITAACDTMLTVDDINAACGSSFERVNVSAFENGEKHYCSRVIGRSAVFFSVRLSKSVSEKREPTPVKGGGTAIADKVGNYTVELRTAPALVTRDIACTDAQLGELFKKVFPRAKKALSAKKK